ncbi:MAG TPA: AmmeMemoRadiSam system protein B [Acidimicrobiales bacterium]
MGPMVAGGVRPAAVAGMFYPSDPSELRDTVAACLAGDDAAVAATPQLPADERADSERADRERARRGHVGGEHHPKAVIAPHAGYRYSGPTAGAAYRALAARRDEIERVVVVGPAHRVRLAGVGISSARAWSTPLGDVEVDVAAVNDLSELPEVVVADDAHAPEHSVEVHLPFVREVFGEVPVVPLVVGATDPAAVGRVLDSLWGGPETAIVISSDLSHYLDDASARRRDRRTSNAIVEVRPADIGPHDACGFLPIGGLLTAALPRGLAPRPLALTTSADTAGDPSRVVGYGSFALFPPPEVGEEDARWLAGLAARAIDHELRTGRPFPLSDAGLRIPEAVRCPGTSFVTLERGTELLGCIGSLDVRRALWRDVARNARGAAFEDPRFPPLAPTEPDGVSVEVSVLSPLEPLPVASGEELVATLEPGVDGLVVAAGDQRGTFLPDVWEKIPEPAAFVRELVRKAGWTEPWPTGARAWRYTTTTAETTLP